MTFEPGADGLPQAVIPGAGREPMRQTLERRMEGRKRPTKPQKHPTGLFHNGGVQEELF
jgi:hypothetical protein